MRINVGTITVLVPNILVMMNNRVPCGRQAVSKTLTGTFDGIITAVACIERIPCVVWYVGVYSAKRKTKLIDVDRVVIMNDDERDEEIA